MVVCWHDFTRGVARGRLASALTGHRERLARTRVGSSLGQAGSTSPIGLVKAWLHNQLDDLLPVVQALRLILRSGLPFIGAYLLLSGVARAVEPWLVNALTWLAVPNTPVGSSVVYLDVIGFVAEFISWTLALCLYAVAFDRAMLRAVNRARQLTLPPAPPSPHPTLGTR